MRASGLVVFAALAACGGGSSSSDHDASIADDAPIVDAAVHDAPGDDTPVIDAPVTPVEGLRINEISSCNYVLVPCWFEVVNVGTATVDLATYHLRTSTFDLTTGPIGPHDFELPTLTIPAGGYAIIRGRTAVGLGDGPNLVHITDSTTNLIPWWQDNGFIELTKSGTTIDFVRLGTSTVTPTTTGWTGVGAPPVPTEYVYGTVIARDATTTDTDTAADWTKRAFATPGGPNDITSDDDTDHDGIPDQAEVAGGTFAGLDLYARGVRTNQRDLLVEIDHMPHATDPAVTPQRAAVDSFVAAYAPHNIVVHPDTGALFSATAGTDYNFGGGNEVTFSTVTSLSTNGANTSLYSLKMKNMDVRLQAVSHYMLFAYTLDVSPSVGIAELGGNDVLIGLGNQGFTTGTELDTQILANEQAICMMHELGHNLGLRHGGDNEVNYKPNYLSIMNYMYATIGLPTVGTAEGDRWYYFNRPVCTQITYEFELTNSRFSSTFHLDYSNGTSTPMNEAAINESAGLGRPTSMPIDFNCDSTFGTVSVDLDNNGDKTETLTDHDDWGAIVLPFAGTAEGSTLVAQPHYSQFTDDRRPVVDETGFVLSAKRPNVR